MRVYLVTDTGDIHPEYETRLRVAWLQPAAEAGCQDADDHQEAEYFADEAGHLYAEPCVDRESSDPYQGDGECGGKISSRKLVASICVPWPVRPVSEHRRPEHSASDCDRSERTQEADRHQQPANQFAPSDDPHPQPSRP